MRAREKTLFGGIVAFVVGVCITLANAQFSGGIGGVGFGSTAATSAAGITLIDVSKHSNPAGDTTAVTTNLLGTIVV